MKKFEDYKDGDWVTFQKPGHAWDGMQFQAYPSKWTPDAFRLKYGDREIIADISEVNPLFNQDIDLPRGHVDSDADFTGIYHVQD